MAEPPNWVFSMFSFIGFVLAFIPLPWHLEAWNTGTCLYMAWAGLSCLNGFINSVVFNKSVLNVAPVWCDISTRMIIGMSVGIPAAALCINRRLYQIASVRTVTSGSKTEKRRAVIVDLAITVGIPVLIMILSYIPQGHRFNIFEDIGCYPAIYNTPPAYPLLWIWPTVISLISACYCAMTIRILAQRRAEFNKMLSGSNNKNLNSGRYLRLMGLAGFEMCLGTPWSVYAGLYLNIHPVNGVSPISPWISWANVHADFSFVGQVPAFVWKAQPGAIVDFEITRWAPVLCSFLFFGFFGFAQEARKNYRVAFNSIVKKVGYTTLGFSSGISSSFGGTKQPMSTIGRGTIPVYIRQETTAKRDSGASFSTNLTLGDVGGTLDDVKEPPSPNGSASSGSSIYHNEKDLESPSHPPALTYPESTLNVPTVIRHDSNIV
ncbi:hypothetical protein PILCRDRAFT_812599 [Piloderma croceum F 1598]|uniref:Uncharacterized protein n=1 Tax=Piloderma croceum (strain F 1598) TaxID=765440 RepID=A0A0C3G0R4_PILCF|nr:hypothetical protein PILCRDRAFT_812599 [Piloderma croceum F 1598]